MDEPTVSDSGIIKPVNNTPSTLQSLCCKTLFMQEQNHLHLSPYYENRVHFETNSENKQNSALNVSPDRLVQNFSPEMDNCDVYSETVNLANTSEWMDLKEFDSYIHHLKTENNDYDPFQNLENYLPQFLIRTNTQVYKDVKKKTLGDDYEMHSFNNTETETVQPNNNLKNNAQIIDDKSLIILSSEDSDFEFSLPDDIDSVSISSIEAYVTSIENKKSKVTIEISPQIEYVTNFLDTTTTSKDTQHVPSFKELETQLKSSSITSKGKTETLDKCTPISLSSDDEGLNDSYCSGYHSSDFEFITEEEASDGLIINFKKTNDTHNVGEVTASNDTNQYIQMSNKWRRSNNNNNCEDYRQNHQIPEGENYFDLFRGIYAPTVPWMYENKSMGLMVNEYRGEGFDIGVLNRQIREYQQDSDEYKQEADECAKKILHMYRRENRKRSRRFY